MRKKTESHTVCQSVDKALFSEACMQMIGALQGQNGIGTLREKTIHSVLNIIMHQTLHIMKSELELMLLIFV